MPQIVQQGSINTAALTVADVYVQIVPPQFLINGLPTNIIAAVGTASWGPVGGGTLIGGYTDYAQAFGDLVPRKYDLGTAVYVANLQGGAAAYKISRVTDGSDTAATATLGVNGMVLTSMFTGSLGNRQAILLNTGSAFGSIMATLSIPGRTPETFNNITKGLQNLAVTPGTGWTSVPTLAISAPTLAGGVQALAAATLTTVGQTIQAPGTGHKVGDQIELAQGVVLNVATVGSNGVITAVTVAEAGSLIAGSVPANPVPQISSTGTGTGAAFNLNWGLGPATIEKAGSGYQSATVTMYGGGSPASGSYAPGVAYWTNLAAAINLGQSGLRGPSTTMIATDGEGVEDPILGTITLLAGGSDGAAGVNGFTMVGQDSLPRSGMYALRGSGASLGMLVDLDDSTTWSTQIAFGLSEGVYMIATGPSGDSIANAASVKTNAGVDSYALKLMLGDWVYFNDTINNQQRLASPQGFVAGALGNLAPNQSSLNKQMYGIVGTQKSSTKVPYTTADLSALAVAGIDVICNPIPAGAMFGCRNGRNTSSNDVIHGDNYTRMTNFIAATLAAAMGYYVGTLQSADQRLEAKATVDFFFQNLWDAKLIGNADDTVPWQTILDDTNNSDAAVALGYEQAAIQVEFLSVVEFLILDVEGGQSVSITRTTSPS